MQGALEKLSVIIIKNFFRIPMQCAFVKNLHSGRKNGKKRREYTDYIVLLFPLG